uniref:ATP-dependent DNA helicase n=1 Tax=Heligmosomoides polygyrus TaxID=6339 RepID=A0A183GGN1_HELPZ
MSGTIRQQIGITKRQIRKTLQEAQREEVQPTQLQNLNDDDLLNAYEGHTSAHDSLYRVYSRMNRLWSKWKKLIETNPEEEEEPLRRIYTVAFFDCGASITMLHKQIAMDLNLRTEEEQPLSLQTFGNSEDQIYPSSKAAVGLLLANCDKIILNVRTLPYLTQPMQMELTGERRRENLQACSISTQPVYVGNDEEIPGERYVVVYERVQGLRTISYLDRLCDPFSYPLLFPRGEDGWHPGMEKTVTGNNRRTRVTQKELYSYLLFARTGRFHPLLHAGKLFQQYVVDSWLKIEMNRLNFLRKNQKELRLDTVRGLHDYMIGDDTHDGPPGRRIILAASFTGGPRHMIGQYQDAMSIVSKYGKPDIFLTFTCNPNWREIQNNLAGGQSASDRPDLVTRVFNLKLRALCNELFKRNVLGEVAAYIYVVEFQKRGLPHAHMLITRRDDGRYVMCRGVRMDNRTCTGDLTSTSITMTQLKLITTKLKHKSTRDMCVLLKLSIAYSMQCRSDAVQRLQVHLPGFEAVTLEAGAEQQALNATQNRPSTLTGYFAINKTCNDLAQQYGRLPEGMVDSRSLHYYEMLQAFEFNKGWRQRKKYARTIGRMYFVGPQEQERFALRFLRFLLLYGKGFTSFEDVRTVEGVLHTTFVSAARSAGYLTDESFFVQSLREAASFHLPAQLRSYFVSLIVYGNLQDPLPVTIWNAHKEDFMEDFVLNGDPTDVAESKAFYDIADLISTFGNDYGEYLNIDIQQLFTISKSTFINTIVLEKVTTLFSIASKIVDDVLLAIERQQGQCFFVDGPGGSGKTFVYTTIYHLATARRKHILNTGIAANLLPNGRTVTSEFRLLVDDKSRSSGMKRQSKEANTLREFDAIILDEAPMAPKQALEAVNSLLQDIM